MRLPLIISTLILSVLALPGRAQEEVYKMELGAMLGGSFYLGDANYTGFYKGTRPMGGIMARYIFTPRLALKGNLAIAGIKGSTGANNKFPFDTRFSRTLYDLGVQIEANFWGYGIGQEFLGYRRFTPYITGGLGFTLAPAPAKTLFQKALSVDLTIIATCVFCVSASCPQPHSPAARIPTSSRDSIFFLMLFLIPSPILPLHFLLL